MNRQPVFRVPDDYFENLPKRIAARLGEPPTRLDCEELSAFGIGLLKQETFSVPAGYFEGLPGQIMARALAAASPAEPLDFPHLEKGDLGILAAIPKKNVFQVPEGYFDKPLVVPTLQQPLQPAHQEARVVRLMPRWAKYAAAVAASVVVFATGYWLYPTNTKAEDCAELLCNLTDDEILQYLDRQDVRNPAPAAIESTTDQLDWSEEELLNAAESY
jgi:hypothetical protein